MVAVRAWPLNNKERKYAYEHKLEEWCIYIEDNQVCLKDITPYQPEEAFWGFWEKEKLYAFDFAFDHSNHSDGIT